MKRVLRVVLIATSFAGIAAMTGCGGKKEEAVKTGIKVVNATGDTIVTDKEGVKIGEADLVIPDTPEELDAFIEQMR